MNKIVKALTKDHALMVSYRPISKLYITRCEVTTLYMTIYSKFIEIWFLDEITLTLELLFVALSNLLLTLIYTVTRI